MLIALVTTLALGASPNVTQLDAQEKLNDALEARFDALCRTMKATGGLAPKEHAAAVRPRRLVWVKNCSFRALSLSGTGGTREARLLWELDGHAADGQRVTERGEASATLTRAKAGWSITRFEDLTRAEVFRAAPRFTDVAAEAGLTFPTARVGHLLLGGLAVRDLDGDDTPDVVATDGADVVAFFQRAPLRFERRVLLAGRQKMWTAGLAVADFDGDGDADLTVAWNPGPIELFRNEAGAFTAAGVLIGEGHWHSLVPADLDADGHLDLAALPYPLEAVPTRVLETTNGYPLALFRGEGGLRFSRWHADFPFPKRWALAGVAADLLGQGRPQLYVANDYGSNDLWRFEADGGLTEVAAAVGVVDPGNGMSADVADFDGDGREDLYVANMFSKAGTRVLASTKGVSPTTLATLNKFAKGNTLYLARDGGFVEVAEAQGVNRGLWAFGSVFTDVDADGRLDVAVANGYLSHPNRRDS
ncbi:MAG: VCBS repeat-containing protein [Myxococcota bacterium]